MKKRALAIILSVLLVVSAVVALAACKEPQQEYSITFRDTAGKTLEVVTTVNGKATPSPKTTKKPGYTHDGWYREIGTDENDRYTYIGLVDLATTVFTEDTELYAKWNRNLTAGEEEGYCVIGKISGLTEDWANGGFDPVEAMNCEEAQLTHSESEINLYYITLDVAALDSFKIKTNGEGWDEGQINGLSPLVDKGEVKLAAGVELPEGIASARDLFTYTYDADNNLGPKCDMNITINFYYEADDSYAVIIINSIDSEIVGTPEEVGFVLCGALTSWADKAPYDGTANAKYIFATEDNNVFTLEGAELPELTAFKVKGNESGWRTQFGYSAIDEVTVADGVELPSGVTAATASTLFGGGGDDGQNIIVKCEMTATITLNYKTKKISIEITEADASAVIGGDNLKGYAIVGKVNGDPDKVMNWEPFDPNYKMTADANNEVFTITGVKLIAEDGFQVKVANNAWGTAQYAGDCATFEFDTSIASEGLDMDDYLVVEDGNVTAKAAVTVTVVFTHSTGTYTVTITEIADIEA